MARTASPVAEQFQRPVQQREADFLGMWLFLATEAMLFGGLFMAMIVYRIIHPDAVREAAGHLYRMARRLRPGAPSAGDARFINVTSTGCDPRACRCHRAGRY